MTTPTPGPDVNGLTTETSHVEPCGCRVRGTVRESQRVRNAEWIVYCPTHAAAPEMLAFVQMIAAGPITSVDVQKARALLARIGG